MKFAEVSHDALFGSRTALGGRFLQTLVIILKTLDIGLLNDKNGINKVRYAAGILAGLYSKGRILGHKRAKRNTRPNTSLVQIEGVATKEDAQFYLGKRVAYVYKAKKEIHGSKVRVIWGRVTRPHGNSGVVKSKFSSNIPPHAFGASVRVMLYPSTI
ncbi:ribosomal protein L35Ae-domain-containing protein [Cristinia sonorae]|uniref:Ribosomal protein L35Ae-domain-containing protein n=1 Tax=Cristinia sonorae TaxID=1940300 RepID=A0A8K0UVR7_9AGAR|nr:ribosomal protein L35Ae-domain-containing protein [Cristinia sonorae]